MLQRATGVILCLLVCAGCTEQPAPASGSLSDSASSGQDQGADASARSAGKADLDARAGAGTTPPASGAAPTPTAPAPPSVGLALDRGVQPSQLAAWVTDETVAAEVRVTSLRRLEASDAGQALDLASRVLSDESASPLLRANAVAVLARSNDARADARLAKLEPKYQHLAERLRARR